MSETPKLTTTEELAALVSDLYEAGTLTVFDPGAAYGIDETTVFAQVPSGHLEIRAHVPNAVFDAWRQAQPGFDVTEAVR